MALSHIDFSRNELYRYIVWFLQNIKLFFQRSRTLDRPHDSGDILSYAIIILCLKKLFKTDVGIYYEIIDAS